MRLHTVYYISVNCCTCFGWKLNPSSWAYITVITASGTGQTSENSVFVKSAKDERYGPYRLCYFPRSRKVAETGPHLTPLAGFTHTKFSEVWPVSDAVITVTCAHDDGLSYHPKHVEQFTEIQRNSKRWTQFSTSICPELYMVCEWST